MTRWLASGLLACAGALVLPGLVMPAAGQPAPPTPRQLSAFDGLPSNTVNQIAEDRQGYLWIATNDGMARFDGRSYRTWRAEDGLRDNVFWAVLADRDNRLWLGTESSGVVRLSADRRQKTFFDRASQPLLASNTVWSLASTADGAVWFGTYDGGLYRVDAQDTLQRFLPEPGNARSLPSNSVPFLATLPDGSLWVGTRRGLARWTGHDFERVALPGMDDAAILGLTADPDGSLWVRTAEGPIVRRPDGRFEPLPWNMPSGDLLLGVMLHDEQGNYWLDTRSGLGLGVGKRYQSVPLYSVLSRGRIRPNWSAAFADREGGIWLASTNAGLWRLLPRWWQFSLLSRLEDDPGSLRNGYVLGTAASASGGIWAVGTQGALDRFDPVTGRIEQHGSFINGTHWLGAVAEDPRGRVWIGSADTLLRYDPQRRHMERWSAHADKDAALEGNIDAIVLCDGRIWTLAGGGVQARNLEGHVQITHAIGQQGLPPGQVNSSLICGPEGQPWLPSSQGLQQWSPADTAFVLVPGAPGTPVQAVSLASEGGVWLAQDGRVSRYLWRDGALQLQQTIGSAHGFPAVAANALLEDEAGIVWATSLRGLLRIDPVHERVRLYGVHDGLRSQEFRQNTLLAAGKRIVAGTPAGVVVFDPERVHPSSYAAPLVIERVEVTRGEQRVDLTGDAQVVVSDADRDLHIVSRLISFNDASTVVYRYRLEGYDPDWVEVDGNGERVFSKLPPGRYELLVQARSADQVWSKVQTLRFQVLPPWWRSAPGLLLFSGLGLLLMSWFAWLYRRRLQRSHDYQMALHKQEVAEQASAAKTRFLATLGHEVRTPMTGVLGMSELLLASPLDGRQRTYTESIRMAGEHLMLLVNEALDLARIESGRLELQSRPFDLHLLLADVRQLMEPLAEQKGLEFVLDSTLPVGVVVTGDLLRVRQVLLNLLANSLKFTQRGSVILRARCGGGEQDVRFEVQDTGPGIGSEQQARLFQRFEQGDGARTAAQYGGSGLGLAISRELVQAMGGSIALESQLGRGTCITVMLPLPWVQGATVPADGAGALHAVEPGRSLSVLVVEDDPTVAEVLTELLQARGHRVTHAAHALAALRDVATGVFDLGLLDLDLPGLSGFDLASHLRNQGYAMPLLAVSARTDADLASKVAAAGMQGLLRKPVTGKLLAAAMADVMGQRPDGSAGPWPAESDHHRGG